MTSPAYFYIDLPDNAGTIGLVAIELPSGGWVMPEQATPAEWLDAARLSASRLPRCRSGSDTWWRHRAVMHEAEKRGNVRLLAVRR
jgi:hypothetical protein